MGSEMLEIRGIVRFKTRSRIPDVLDWDPEDEPEQLCTAEQAECTCPEFCERDHDVD
jgi:hypothetical protein